MVDQRTSSLVRLQHFVLPVGVAIALGLASGALMVRLTPVNEFSWVGLALIPLWFLQEVVFELAVGVLGERSKAVRVLSTLALMAGFCVAWFAFRA